MSRTKLPKHWDAHETESWFADDRMTMRLALLIHDARFSDLRCHEAEVELDRLYGASVHAWAAVAKEVAKIEGGASGSMKARMLEGEHDPSRAKIIASQALWEILKINLFD